MFSEIIQDVGHPKNAIFAAPMSLKELLVHWHHYQVPPSYLLQLLHLLKLKTLRILTLDANRNMWKKNCYLSMSIVRQFFLSLHLFRSTLLAIHLIASPSRLLLYSKVSLYLIIYPVFKNLDITD